jgi:hypothetical protein
MTQRKKKRKKRRYKTGEHSSIKLLNGPAHFRSGWEKCYMKWLDDNDDIKSYSYESVIIGYLGNKSTGKMRHYYPDLLLEYIDGHKQLVEIKPSSKVEQKTNQKKFEAAKVWCKDHDCEFIIMTEIEMKKFGINLLI